MVYSPEPRAEVYCVRLKIGLFQNDMKQFTDNELMLCSTRNYYVKKVVFKKCQCSYNKRKRDVSGTTPSSVDNNSPTLTYAHAIGKIFVYKHCYCYLNVKSVKQ